MPGISISMLQLSRRSAVSSSPPAYNRSIARAPGVRMKGGEGGKGKKEEGEKGRRGRMVIRRGMYYKTQRKHISNQRLSLHLCDTISVSFSCFPSFPSPFLRPPPALSPLFLHPSPARPSPVVPAAPIGFSLRMRSRSASFCPINHYSPKVSPKTPYR